MQGSRYLGKTWKIREKIGKVKKNQGKPGKFKEVSWKIEALRENPGNIFTFFNLMIL